MDANELLDILYTVPFNKLTNGSVYCRINTFTDVVSNLFTDAVSSLARVDIDFMKGNTCIGFIRVFGNNTIDPALPEEYERNTTYKCYSECFTAMKQVITYLEILGFRTV